MMYHSLPEDQIAAYKAAFDLFDTDGNGTISPQEIGGVMHNLGQNLTETALQTIVQGVDANDDGTIDFEEFLTLMQDNSTYIRYSGTKQDGDAIRDAEILEVFKLFDENKDGKISIKELENLMSKLGERLSDIELKAMIEQADKDGDGEIDFEEFHHMVLSQ